MDRRPPGALMSGLPGPQASEAKATVVPLRRRGAALLAAIHVATLEEVADVGFEAATVEGIAARAGAGKASIYKRWSSREEIVLAAVSALDDPLLDVRRSVEDQPQLEVRTALLDVLGRYAEGLDTVTGRALRSLMTQRERHPELYESVYRITVVPRQELLRFILTKAADAGQIRRERITPWVIGAGPRLLIAQHMERGEIREEDLTAVVDQILLPALGHIGADALHGA